MALFHIVFPSCLGLHFGFHTRILSLLRNRQGRPPSVTPLPGSPVEDIMTPAFARLIARSRNGLRAARLSASLLALGLIALPTIARALPSGSVTIDSIAVTQTTGEKP